MKTRNKLLSVMLCMLVITTSIPIAASINVDEQNNDEKSNCKYPFFIIGLISPTMCRFVIDGFYPMFVLTNRNPGGIIQGLGSDWVDLTEYDCKGYVGNYFICAVLS